jgi:(S)-3,5-dihydroxyphenylglycine transaminase
MVLELSDLLLDGLDQRFPHECRSEIAWNTPTGGFSMVLTVPFPAGDDLLEYSARTHGVLWTPMHHFYGDGVPRRELRLSFSHHTPAELATGLDRLAAFVDEQCAREGTATPQIRERAV